MGWNPFDAGSTLGQVGSEQGRIVLDEESDAGARITLEAIPRPWLAWLSGRRRPAFAITCGVYGLMLHTRFFGSEREAKTEYERMKPRLEAIAELDDREASGLAASAFVDDFS